MKKETHTKQNTYFFFALFAGVIILSYFVIKPYLVMAIMAFLLTALYSPVYKMFKKVVVFDSVASFFTLITMAISVILPMSLVGYLSYNQVLEFNNDIQGFLKANNLISGEEVLDATDEDEEKSILLEINERLRNGNSVSDLNSVFRVNENGDLERVNEDGDFERVNPDKIGGINVEEAQAQINDTIQKVPFMEDQEVTREELENFVKDIIGPATDFLADTAISIGGSSFKIITYSIVFVILLMSFFPAHERLAAYYKRLSPLDDDIDQSYITRITDMGVAMIKGTFVIASLQGILSGIFLYIAGVEYVVFWTLLSIVVSIIPLGAGIVNIPIAFVLILTGNVWQGVMIILANIFIVGQVDTLLRPSLVPKDAELNSTLTLLSILGGVQLFGPLGFIFGPIVMIFLQTSVDVYLKHYKEELT